MLSQGVGYAITALGYIAAAGGKSVLVKEIADMGEVPGPYLAKIINALSKRGIVNTQRGVGGGVTLARPATDISLHDLCIALDDPAVQPMCLLGNAACSDERSCPAHKFWRTEREKINQFLLSTSVADVAMFEARRRWKHGPSWSSGARGGGDGIHLPVSGKTTGDVHAPGDAMPRP